ncbi:FAD-binding and (Fe-S)-binding domain-containing protein [Georgenia sp. AZ-5]|uniref:FAD-binding and (Fe-S)-binding domain-containing protein n=1 Tax=Georgenia sp. AZ-5 TaxID=3367526 RepID=UPI003753EF91
MTTGPTRYLPALAAAVAPGSLSTRAVDRARLAHDASHYRMVPRAVVTPATTEEVAAIMMAATRDRVALTFRSGGTSLSGQAVTDGVLVDTRRHRAEVTVLDDGARVRCEPGAVLRRVNAALAPYHRRLGPDPASEGACTIGGVVANNSSGMTSGTAATAYRTVESMVLVLPSGTIIDTARPDADALLRVREPELHAGLLRLRDRVRGDASLRARIEHQFSMKNTMGYGLNAFLDHDDAVCILQRLLIGSEGTLGYVAEVTLRTLPTLPHTATTLCIFPSINAATDAIAPLAAAGAVAIELMDPRALRVAQRDPRASEVMRAITVEHHTALLVELQEATAEELADSRARLEPVMAALDLSVPAVLTSDPMARGRMWTVRKGLYAAVAGARPPGTTALLEDVVVPPRALTGTVKELGALLGRYGYDDAVTFGHARDANLHFMINPRLDVPSELEAYAAFTEELVDLVLRADGSLKAEHGTGRIMAPFVRRQYGDALYDVMCDIKALCDPVGVLNPGVILNEDPRAHLRHLKTVPAVHPELDRCVECGYCEPVCPSRNTTTTPRQRITLLREIAVAPPRARAELEQAYDYQAVQTCAADSMCDLACPVSIDTGLVMKSFRAQGRGTPLQTGGTLAARAWRPVTAALRGGLKLAEQVPDTVLSGTTRVARRLVGHRLRDWIPQLGPGLPGAAGSRLALLGRSPAVIAVVDGSSLTAADAVFFPACIGSVFAPEGGGTGAGAAFLRLCERAGLDLAAPAVADSLCCGTVWDSKGLVDGAAVMARKVAEALWPLTDEGRIPVVCDASSCTHGLAGLATLLPQPDAERWSQVQVLDAVTFVRRRVLPVLGLTDPQRRLRSLALHPTCSSVHLQITDDLEAVARAVARDVTVPMSWGCCGTAGDRGLLHPELSAAATEPQAAELAALERALGPFDAYASCNRTCEMGMTAATGRPYRHVLEILEQVTRH